MMAQDDDSLLKSLIDLVEAVPKFVRPQVERLVASCMKVYPCAPSQCLVQSTEVSLTFLCRCLATLKRWTRGDR